jgi:hypothetical protein
MNLIVYSDIEYIQGDYVLQNAPIYSKGCRGTRDLIKKKNITEYIFMRLTNDKWVLSNGSSQKLDKVFVLKSLLDTIPELNKSEKIVDDNGIEKAPDIIYLEEHEKFYDNEGNTIDIETRGERNVECIYFKVKDIMEGFKLNRLNEYIVDKRRIIDGYIENKHYKYFICNKHGAAVSTTNKELFLTYKGIMRVLFASQSSTADKFLYWATNTLFTVQMGTVKQKDYLVSSIKGVSYDAIQELFSINARELPCIYLTSLNRVDVLRNAMNIDDIHLNESVVYKYGMTKSFESRKNGHNQEYKKLDGLIDKKLVYYTYIDPLYLREAESEIKNMLEDLQIKWDIHEELVVIPNHLMKYVKECFKSIGMKYAGHSAELIKEITELKCKNEMLIKEYEKEYNHKLELKDKDTQLLLKDSQLLLKEKDNQLLLKDNELKEKDNEILKKELEIMKLKYEK